MKALDTKQFIEKAIKVHGDKYDYSKSNYVNNKSKITIICPTHGEFNQIPNKHLQGQGCKQCGITSRALSRTKDTKQFIEKAIKVHGDKYDYSNSDYEGALSKITIICPIHGEFNQTPNSHLRGSGCKQCGIESQTGNKEQFIEDAIKVHGDKYDYSKIDYKKNNSKVTIICPIHGEFNQIPNNHLQGQGCKQCGITSRTLSLTGNKEQFIEDAIKVHGDKYDYSKIDYTKSYSKITIICPIHGEFNQIPSNHLQGYGCNQCKIESQTGENNYNWNPDREYVKLRKRISNTCSQFIRRILKYTGGKKNNKAEIILGYTRTELMNHIENHENWNDLKHTDYHIDHIFPVKAFVDHNIEDPKIICALDNLRPLSAFDNISKNDNYDNNEFYKYMSRKYGKKKCSQWNIPFIYT